jgi:Ca2+-dependent lipid-binding protein
MKKLETDSESLEWMNNFMVKLWPVLAPFISMTVIQSVDQVLSTTTPAFLDSMRLKVFTLGSKPPRMEYVKSYPRAEDDIVIMDWKFSFSPKDTDDMTVRQKQQQVNPKVMLEVRVGKGVVSKGLDIIVEDMALIGLMRIKMKLQLNMPFIERIEVSFLEPPTLDYKCKPLGGDTFGFDINFIPGLETFILQQVHANLGPILYAPNSFPIEVAKIMAGTPVDQAIGVVQLTLHGAQGVKNSDAFAGTPDPYVSVSLGGRAELARTKVVKENANPKWNETKYIIINNFTESLNLTVFDFNELRADKNLGSATFALGDFESTDEFENIQLEIMSNGKAKGIIQADARFFPVLEGRALPDGTKEEAPESNTGILKYTIEQAKDLDGSKSMIGSLNPYAALIVNNKEVQITRKLKRTNNPIWDNGTKEILITDRKKANLGLVIKDDRGIQGDPILGNYAIRLDDLVDMTKKGNEWFSLASAKSGRVKITAQWKPVGLKGVLGGSGGYVPPVGALRFHFKNAKDLRNLETMGKSDPYVRVLLSGIEKARTVTFQNNLNPEFDEVQYVAIHSVKEKLAIEVMDQESLGKDRSLGLFEVSVAEYVKQNEAGEYMPYENKATITSGLMMKGIGAPKGTLNYSVSFFPCLNVADPEEEEEEKHKAEEAAALAEKEKADATPVSPVEAENQKLADKSVVDSETAKLLAETAKHTAEERKSLDNKPARLHLTPEELLKYGMFRTFNFTVDTQY